MNDGVARIGIGRPDGVKRQRLIERLPEGEGCAILSLPATEFVAGAGGGGGRGGRCAALYERGRDIGAALRIVGNPVTLLNLGLEGYVAAVQRDGGYEIAARVLPADDGFLIADGVGHLCSDNLIACMPLLRDHDFALLIGEEDEVHVIKVRVISHRFRLVNSSGMRESQLIAALLRIKPADEFLIRVVRRRRAGVIQRFAVLQNLAREHVIFAIIIFAIHEDIGARHSRRCRHRQHRNRNLLSLARIAAAGDDLRQRVHRQHADEHHYRHQQRDKFFELSHVLDPSALFLTFFKIAPGDA